MESLRRNLIRTARRRIKIYKNNISLLEDEKKEILDGFTSKAKPEEVLEPIFAQKRKTYENRILFLESQIEALNLLGKDPSEEEINKIMDWK